MARKKESARIKKFLIIAGTLVLVQVLYLYVFRQASEPVTVRDAMSKAVIQKTGISDQRKAQLKVQLALADFQAKNKKLPTNLSELVPTYFDVVPNDPESGKPFAYRVDNGQYFLGEAPTPTPAPGSVTTTGPDQAALVASLDPSAPAETFVYDPTGKRDPFRPFDFSPKVDSSKTPLERYSLSQLTLKAILDGFDEPAALVENSTGKGFTIKRGTKIGPNGGEVVEILKDKIIILETVIDFTGAKKSQTTELTIRTKDQDAK